MSDYRRLEGMDVRGKRVLVRVDYNVKVKDGKIKDDTRITESLPTVKYLIDNGAKTIIMAHFGRPQEEIAEGASLDDVVRNNSVAPIARHLGKLIGKDVKLAPGVVGDDVSKIAGGLNNGEVMMLENLRLAAEEEANDKGFAFNLASLCDIYVFDGFGVSHRAHASTTGVPLYLYSIGRGQDVVAGFLMDKELKLWSAAREKKGEKMLVVGGIKFEEKTKAVLKLYKAVNSVLAAGGIYNIVQASRGINVAESIVSEKETNYVGAGKEIDSTVKNLVLASNVVVANKANPADYRAVPISGGIPAGYMIMDLVVDKPMADAIGRADVIIWFGNLGASDFSVNGQYPFAAGTEAFKRAINPNAYVVVGGGDSVTASNGIANRVISTGGGAAITLYTKGTLDALEALRGNTAYFAKK